MWVAPPTTRSDQAWTAQQARNFTMAMEDMGIKAKYLVHDRDARFGRKFNGILETSGARYVQIPRKSPNCNAYCESWVASVKRECLDHFVCFGEGHLDHILQEYRRFYNHYRAHQGKGNAPLRRLPRMPKGGEVACESRLGGVLRHYHRRAS